MNPVPKHAFWVDTVAEYTYYMGVSRQKLLRQLLRAAPTMIQGSLSETTRRCGNPNCACHRDPARRHGPHLYITWAEGGRSRSLYVPAEQTELARRAHAAWAQFWETAVALAVQNREQFRQQCQGEKSTSRRPHGSTPASPAKPGRGLLRP